jgi:hypothetical protein
METKLPAAVITAFIICTFALNPCAAQQVEGNPVNRWQKLSNGTKLLILRMGPLAGLSSSNGSVENQHPVFVVNYRTAFAATQKAQMAKEAVLIVPTLKSDLAGGTYSELMLCPYHDKDTGESPYDMFMFNKDSKGNWKKTP